jgi:amino-acid N-acetyltransferase
MVVGHEVIRPAGAADAVAIVDLVEGAGLPLEGVRENLGEFLVAERDGRVTGCCGLEIYGTDALLRSVAVAPSERGGGTGARLVERALSGAVERGLASITLLTTTAAGYFPRFGFREIDRGDVPDLVRESKEFLSVCPSTATCMSMRLDRDGRIETHRELGVLRH